MKILQPIFGALVDLTKNEVTKICNESGIKGGKISQSCFNLALKKNQIVICDLVIFFR